jgi:hypothetical protein
MNDPAPSVYLNVAQSLKEFAVSLLRVVRDGLITAARFATLLFLYLLVLSFYALLPYEAAEKWPTWGVAAVLPFFVVALGVGLFWIYEDRRRKRFVGRLMRDGLLGWLSPVLVGGFIFLLAASVFASATFVLQRWGILHLAKPACARCTPRVDELLNFYTWHFLDAVPLLDINRSLRWRVPLTYTGALTGWFVIAFQAVVILPLIQAVRTYVELRGVTPRLRLRPWAWPRATRVGRPINVNWSPSPPPEGFAFDVMVSHRESAGEAEVRWLTGTALTSERYTAEWPGTYRFRAECRKRLSDDVLRKLDAIGSSAQIRSWRAVVTVKR